MAGQNDTTTREERLAAKLRENLKRRKEQARAQRPRDDGPAGELEDGGGDD